METRASVAFELFDQAELRFCRYLNRSSGYLAVRSFFSAVSWLGNGKFWYGLMAALPFVAGGIAATSQMVVTSAIGVLLYKLIKAYAVRERPFITHRAIHCAAAPLDRYSFPSGHTLHAVCFTAIAATYYPALAAPLIAFTLLVALSRVVLGLHYPTDVAAGGVLGGLLAFASLTIYGPV